LLEAKRIINREDGAYSSLKETTRHEQPSRWVA